MPDRARRSPRASRRSFGPIVLHGAYGEYINCELMVGDFVKHGYRVLIPAAPTTSNGRRTAPTAAGRFFWSTELVVSGPGPVAGRGPRPDSGACGRRRQRSAARPSIGSMAAGLGGHPLGGRTSIFVA